MTKAATRRRRRNPGKKLPVVCAWCGLHLEGPKPTGKQKISHGICQPCLDVQFEEIEKTGKLPPQEPHRSNPHCWWLREPYPPEARANPEVEPGVTSTMPERPWGRVFKQVNTAIDQAFQKATIDSAIQHLKTKAWHLFVKEVLPARVKARKMQGWKAKFERKPATPTQLKKLLPGRTSIVRGKGKYKVVIDPKIPLALRALNAQAWDLFASWRLETAPEIEHPVDHLVELVTSLEMALAGTGPVPRPWAFKMTLEAHQFLETVEYRYKTEKGAIRGTERKAATLRAGTKTKRPNEPAAAVLEQAVLRGNLLRKDWKGGPIPKKDAMPQFRKRVAPALQLAAIDERLIGVALYTMKTSPAIAKMAKAWEMGIPAAYGGTRSWGSSTPSWKGRGFTFVDLRGHEKKFLQAGSGVGDVGGTLRNQIEFMLVMKIHGPKYGYWFLGSQLQILYRGEGYSDQGPDNRHNKFKPAIEKKAWNIIVRPGTLPVLVGPRNFEEAARRFLEFDQAGRDKWNVYPFDADRDVKVIWNGYTSKKPKPTKAETHVSVALVSPALIEPFYVVLKHRPGKKASKKGPAEPGFIPGMAAGGTISVSFPIPMPPSIWQKAFVALLQDKEIRGLAPSKVVKARSRLIPQKRLDAIVKANRPRKQEAGVESGMCHKWPDTYDEAKEMFGAQDWAGAPELWPELGPPKTAWGKSTTEWASPMPGGPHEELDKAWRGESDQDWGKINSEGWKPNPILYRPGMSHQEKILAQANLLLLHPSSPAFQHALKQLTTDQIILSVNRIVDGGNFPLWWGDTMNAIDAEMSRRIENLTTEQGVYFRKLLTDPGHHKRNPQTTGPFPPRRNPMDLLILTNPTKIASILFEKKKWTRPRIRKWLKAHGYKTKISRTKKSETYFRAPQRSTKPKVRTITFSEKEGIKALVLVEEAAPSPARKNPEPSSEAVEQYQAFHASEPENVITLEDSAVPVPPKELVALGELEHVQYKAPDHSGKKGAPWRHNFGDTVHGMDPDAEKPILATDKDGKGLYIVGGDYEVKPEGIVR